MQRAFKPRRTAVDPRNALRLADKQSLGLLVGFLLRRRRLAARVLLTGVTLVQAGPVKADSTHSARRADLSVQGTSSVASGRLASVFTGR